MLKQHTIRCSVVCFLLLCGSCTKHRDDAIKLGTCEEYPICDTTNVNGLQSIHCEPTGFDFAEPCFSGQSGDTLNLRFTLPIKTAVFLEILDDDENSVEVLKDGDSLMAGRHTISWLNNRGYEILGVRLHASSYSKTYWFFTE